MTFARATTGELTQRVRIGVRARRLDAAPTVLAVVQDEEVTIQPGATVRLEAEYRDAADEAERVAGVDVRPPAAADIDAVDDAGVDRASDLDIDTAHGATLAVWNVRNPTADAITIRRLQARGRGPLRLPHGLRRRRRRRPRRGLAPGRLPARRRHLPARRRQPRGPDLRHALPRLEIAEGVAAHVRQQYATAVTRCESVTLHAGRDPAHAALAAALDVGDVIEVVDDLAGIASRHHIHRVAVAVGAPDDVRVTYELSDPREQGDVVWQLSVSRLGKDTRLAIG